MFKRTVKKGIWLSAGILFLLLAIIGLLLPVIPQLPFFLVSVFCFMRCSNRFNAWIRKQHWFQHIKQRLPKRKKGNPSSIDWL